MEIQIDSHTIGTDKRPYVIAEAGVNFRDDLELAKAFIEEASSAGANAVKFQTHLPSEEMVESEMERLGMGDLFKRMHIYELSPEQHQELYDYCTEHDVTFLSTPFSTAAVDRLSQLDVEAYKIGSGELTNHHLLAKVADTGKPIIVSTGMHPMSAVRDAHELLSDRGAEHCFLYCVSEYPTKPNDFNLGVIDRMREEFGVPVGFSDHSTGVQAAAVAMARGASVVEKHFTIDRRLPGGDQEVSLEPEELAELCEFAELVHATRSDEKQFRENEANIAEWARHSVVTAASIRDGETLTEENLTTKRPGTGLPASRYFEIIGQKTARNLDGDQVLQAEDIS